MPLSTTRLKLTRKLKRRIARLSLLSGQTEASFILRALENEVEQAEAHLDFLANAARADKAMQKSGLGYSAADVHTYLDAQASGKQVRRPAAIRWRS